MVRVENIAKIVVEKIFLKKRKFDSSEEVIHDTVLNFLEVGPRETILYLPPPDDSETRKNVDIQDTPGHDVNQ